MTARGRPADREAHWATYRRQLSFEGSVQPLNRSVVATHHFLFTPGSKLLSTSPSARELPAFRRSVARCRVRMPPAGMGKISSRMTSSIVTSLGSDRPAWSKRRAHEGKCPAVWRDLGIHRRASAANDGHVPSIAPVVWTGGDRMRRLETALTPSGQMTKCGRTSGRTPLPSVGDTTSPRSATGRLACVRNASGSKTTQIRLPGIPSGTTSARTNSRTNSLLLGRIINRAPRRFISNGKLRKSDCRETDHVAG